MVNQIVNYEYSNKIINNKNLKRDFKKIVSIILLLNKVVKINVRKGAFVSFGELKNRNCELWWYKLRDQMAGVLYSCQRLLIELYKREDLTKYFLLLQKYMLNSSFIRLLSIDKVLKNKGSKTPGVDGKNNLSDKELNIFLFSNENYLVTGINYDVKRILIPKDGSHELRPLGLPNLMAKFSQDLVKVLIEPILEMEDGQYKHKQSFGFKKSHSCHIAIKNLFDRLPKPLPSFIINLDLKKCFDTILHSVIIEELRNRNFYPIKIVEKMLTFKTYLDGQPPILNYGMGTPQGGVLSPLLCNLVLNRIKSTNDWGKNFNYIRYADDFVIWGFGNSNERFKLLEKEFLKIGIGINKDKTEIYNPYKMNFEFTFLGYQISCTNRIFHLSIPEKKINKFKKKVIDTIMEKKTWNGTSRYLFNKLTPVLRGWSGFYCLINQKLWRQYSFSLDMFIWKQLEKWTLNKRTTKGKKKVFNKYWTGYKKTLRFFYWKLNSPCETKTPIIKLNKNNNENKNFERVCLLWLRDYNTQFTDWNKYELPKGHLWDKNFTDWYKKGLSGYIFAELNKSGTTQKGKDRRPICFICKNILTNDVLIIAQKNNNYIIDKTKPILIIRFLHNSCL
jgi:RNA-directed DNA polymerase